MDEKTIKTLKEKLKKQKLDIEKELDRFAKRNKKIKGDWNAKFPKWNIESAGSSALETAADQVEEYGKLLSLENKLETHLKSVVSALEKIKKGEYGICENCNKKIPTIRLKVYPEARTCLKC